MASFRYQFFYNSEAVGFSDGLGFFRKEAKLDRHPTLDGFLPMDELTLAFTDKIEVAVGGDDQDAINKHVCEMLFRLFNAPFERPYAYAGPSMSVGDVVVLNPDTAEEAVYAVRGIGFEKIDRNVFRAGLIAKPSKLIPSRWIRTIAQSLDYIQMKVENGETLTIEEEKLYTEGV